MGRRGGEKSELPDFIRSWIRPFVAVWPGPVEKPGCTARETIRTARPAGAAHAARPRPPDAGPGDLSLAGCLAVR